MVCGHVPEVEHAPGGQKLLTYKSTGSESNDRYNEQHKVG